MEMKVLLCNVYDKLKSSVLAQPEVSRQESFLFHLYLGSRSAKNARGFALLLTQYTKQKQWAQVRQELC